ncbi:hypothetical protein PsorP6_000587 [Peronosclerospora sorghi]|uniref:Uncharacterized protein n=1 Tax=Peronosclerospora sorghi TaxID=230839 RepID=A0ACC0WRN9_9STRA|nr:hypothetical protein PsorP6_000587 [Peronosclerospora sorghi]
MCNRLLANHYTVEHEYVDKPTLDMYYTETRKPGIRDIDLTKHIAEYQRNFKASCSAMGIACVAQVLSRLLRVLREHNAGIKSITELEYMAVILDKHRLLRVLREQNARIELITEFEDAAVILDKHLLLRVLREKNAGIKSITELD